MTELHLGNEFNQPLVAWNPAAILASLQLPKNWTLGASQLRLPPSLAQLTLPRGVNASGEPLNLLHLPCRLHTLRLYTGVWMDGDDLAALTLPHSLTSLDLGVECDAALDHVQWPPHLTRLMTGRATAQLVSTIITDRANAGW